MKKLTDEQWMSLYNRAIELLEKVEKKLDWLEIQHNQTQYTFPNSVTCTCGTIGDLSCPKHGPCSCGTTMVCGRPGHSLKSFGAVLTT